MERTFRDVKRHDTFVHKGKRLIVWEPTVCDTLQVELMQRHKICSNFNDK